MCTNVHSFDYLLDYYISARIPAEATIKQYRLVIRLFQKDTKITDIRDIDKLVVNQWRNDVYNRASAATCNNYIRHLKSLFNCALQDEVIAQNPFATVKAITSYKKTHRSTNTDDVAKAIEYLRGEDQEHKPGWFWIAVIKMLYFTGMRRKQLVKLCWKDINFNDHRIKLKAESSKNKREWEIPLDYSFLQNLILLKKETWDVLGVDCDIEEQQIFNITLFNPYYHGNEMTEEQLSGFFKRISKKVGVTLSTHRFRHRLATELVNKKDDIKVVQELLGHTNILTTYGYVTTDMAKMRSLVSEITPL